MSQRVLTVAVVREPDVVLARQRAKQVAVELGFDLTEQTRIATAVSEIVRNAYVYAGGGTVEFTVEGDTAPQLLIIHVADHGPGIADLSAVLDGTYRSRTGLGLGIVGARRLVDHLDVVSAPGCGTRVVLKKLLPKRQPPLTTTQLGRLGQALVAQRPVSVVEELQMQNQELLRTLEELRARQDELLRLNQELEDTNRGVVALYAELDERADHLRRADELKSRFLSNMTHEFRTPVNSILALTDLLTERMGDDQKAEPYYIRKAAEQLAELVDDVLDLAKVEAGKTVVRPVRFEVATLMSALRGMLRPLLLQSAVALVFEDVDGLPPMLTDDTKVSQILRNFISNAIKYTEQGEVRVSTRLNAAGDAMVFTVSDTGIGIPAQDLGRIFEEFVQVDHPLQRRVKGTGLGLPLSRRLAELLGGSIAVESTVGAGSRFELTLPLIYRPAVAAAGAPTFTPDCGRRPVLVVEDSPVDALLYAEYLQSSPFQPVIARTPSEAEAVLSTLTPVAVVLDVRLFGEDSWDFLLKLKQQVPTRDIPIVVASQQNEVQKGLALGADAYGVKPIDRGWLVETLMAVTGTKPRRALVIDDEEPAQYVARRLMTPAFDVLEATSGARGIEMARMHLPDVIVLDLSLPDLSGDQVLSRLRGSASTASIPVVVLSSADPDPNTRANLSGVSAVLNKRSITRESLLQVLAAATDPGGTRRSA